MPIHTAPTPKTFADTWTRAFAGAVRDAAAGKKSIALDDVKKVAPRFADNVRNYLEKTGMRSVGVDELIAAAHRYAEAAGQEAAGKDGRISLTDARSLPQDLVDDFFALRGAGRATPLPVAKLQAIARDFEALDYVSNIDDRVGTEVKGYTRAKTVDDVKAAVEKSMTAGGFWNVDSWTDTGKTGQAAVDGFIENAVDGLTGMAGEAGEKTEPLQRIADRLSSVLKAGSYADARLLSLDVYGPQLADTRTVLVLTGKDGKLASISADEVDY